MSRTIKRAMLKQQYERFCRAWRHEKSYQKWAEENGEDIGEGVQKLGRKPTFKMWLDAVNNKKIAASAEQQAEQANEKKFEEKQVEVQDTDW